MSDNVITCVFAVQEILHKKIVIGVRVQTAFSFHSAHKWMFQVCAS